MEVAQDHEPVQRRQDELEKKYAGLESKTKRLIDAYQDEVIQLDELRARMGPLRTRQRAIKTEIEALHMETQGHFDSLMVTQNVQAFLTRMEEGEKNLWSNHKTRSSRQSQACDRYCSTNDPEWFYDVYEGGQSTDRANSNRVDPCPGAPACWIHASASHRYGVHCQGLVHDQ